MIDHILKNAVLETTSTQGTDPYQLEGPKSGQRAFRDKFPDQHWVCAVIEQRQEDVDGNIIGITREVVLGKVTHGDPDTVSRDQVLDSDNGGAAVDWGSGTKDIYVAPASQIFGWNLAGCTHRTSAMALNITHHQLLVLCDADGGPYTQALPDGGAGNIFPGWEITLFKTDDSANEITIQRAGDDLIHGQTSIVLAGQHDFVRLVWTGTAWKIVGQALDMEAIEELIEEDIQAAVDDLKASRAAGIGDMLFVWDHLDGVDPPDNSGPHKWIKLTADEDGDGQYNEGLLENESVSGSAPLVQATAEISVGPLAGQVVPLVNTEESYLRPRAGESGTLQQDQIQNITGEFGRNFDTNNFYYEHASGAFGLTGATASRPGGSSGSGFRQRVDFAASRVVRAGNETRSKNRGVTAYMYIGEIV